MLKDNNYKPGNPEYDYWNDKNLYPSLRHDGSHRQSTRQIGADDSRIGFGTVFLVVFIWLLLLAPVSLFSTWENWLFQMIFWGGIAVILVTLVICFYNAFQEEKQKKG